MANKAARFPYCVYTLLHTDKLDAIRAGTREPTAHEKRRWVTGKKLFDKATAQGQAMPILFGPADGDTGLVYWAILTAVDFNGAETVYQFKDLTPLPEKLPLHSLLGWQTGKPLDDNNIWPYNLCETPSFLSGVGA